LIEVMAGYVGTKERSGWENFKKFLEYWSKDNPEPILWQWGDLKGSPAVDWGSGPKVLDPCNPTNNIARTFRHWSDLRKYAQKSLEMILEAERVEQTESVPPKATWAERRSRKAAAKLKAAQAGLHTTVEHQETSTAGGDLPSANGNDDSSSSTDLSSVSQEVKAAFDKFGIDVSFLKKLADDGFTSIQHFQEFLVEQDLRDVGMNKVQARQILKELGPNTS